MGHQRGLLKDADTGRIRATRHFIEAYGYDFFRVGYDLNKPFRDEKAFLHATIDTLGDEACDALAVALGLIGEDNE